MAGISASGPGAVRVAPGTIELNGVELTGLKRNALRRARRHIGMIFQGFNLVDRLTVMENLLSGRLGSVGFFASLTRRFAPHDVRNAYALLERVGLRDYERRSGSAPGVAARSMEGWRARSCRCLRPAFMVGISTSQVSTSPTTVEP